MINAIESLLGLTFEEVRNSDALLGVSVPEPEMIDLDSYVEIPEEGVSLVLPRGERVTAVQLYSEGKDGYSEFSGSILSGLNFSMSRKAVREKIGEPKNSGEATSIPILGEKPAWDKFDVGEFFIHIEYSQGLDKIGLITVTKQKF